MLFRKYFLAILSGFLICVWAINLPAQTQSEKLLPDTTQGFLVVKNAHTFASELEYTNFGTMFQQEEVRKAIESIEKQIQAILKEKKISIGDFHDFAQVASGEVSFAVLTPDEKTMGVCLLVETAEENDGQAKKLIENIGKELKARGAKVKKTFKVNESTVFPYEIEKKNGIVDPVNAYYALAKNWMVITNNKSVTEQVIQKIYGADMLKTLDSVPQYQKVVERCKKERKGIEPHVRWYVDPFGFAHALKAGVRRSRKKEYLPKLSKKMHGLVGIRGMGGEITINDGKHELMTRSYVYAPNLYELKGVVQALDFRNGGKVDLNPEAWVPTTAGAYSAMVIDLQKAYRSSFDLVDDITDNKDTVKNFVSSLRKRADLKVDVESEIIANLGKKISFVSDPDTKSPKNAERLLICIEIAKNEKAVEAAVNRMLEISKRRGVALLHEQDGVKIWEVLAEEVETKKPNGVEIGGVPGLDDEPAKPEKKKKLLDKPLVESQVFFVTKSRIMISNNVAYAKQIIKAAADGGKKPLFRDSIAFKDINKSLDALVDGADSIRQFGQTAKLYRAGYEMSRTGKIKDSKSILATVINMALKPKPGEKPLKRIDASALPKDYDKFIAPYLGDFGVAVKSEKDGWFVTGLIKKPVVDKAANKNKKSAENKAADKK